MGGCTTSTDHLYIHPRPKLIDTEIRAAKEVGLRFHPVCVRWICEMRPARPFRRASSRTSTKSSRTASALLTTTTTDHPMRWCALRSALAPTTTPQRSSCWRPPSWLSGSTYGFTRIWLQDPAEEAFCVQKYGVKPVDRLDQNGWGSHRTWVAHSIFVSDDEIARLGKWGTGVSHCPSSNSLICEGIAPVRGDARAGRPRRLGERWIGIYGPRFPLA